MVNQFPALKNDVDAENHVFILLWKGLVTDKIIQYHRKSRRPSLEMIS